MLLFMDGCSHYAVAQLGQKWTSKTDASVTWDVLAEGRTDGAIKRTSTSNGGNPGNLIFSPLFTQAGAWTQTASGVFGCALKIENLAALDPIINSNSFNMTQTFLTVYNGVWAMFGLTINQNGTLSLWRRVAVGGGSTLLATSLTGIDNDEWTYLEVKWTISATTGSLEIRSNGTTILNYTGVLYPSAFPFSPPTELWNSIQFLGMKSQTTPLLLARTCDILLFDQNSPNGDFAGDQSIAYIKPDGIGAQSNWTPFPGAPNWNKVNEVPPDSDTTYVETTPPGTRDTYTFEDVLGDPIAIQVCNFCRKTGLGGASLSVITRQGGADHDGPSQGIGSTSYDYLLQPYDTNPHTGVQWTKAQMDAGEWGPLKSV